MPYIRIMGLLLLALATIWVIGSIVTYDHWKPDPAVLGIGNAFQGTAQLPKEEIEKQIGIARDRMIEVNDRGRWLSLAGDIGVWLSFICTALITLIAGYFGRVPGAGGTLPNTGGLPPKPTRAIGLFAALAAVLTAGGTMATNRGHDAYDRADQARTLINQATKAILDAQTEREAHDALDALKLKIDRL